MKTVKVLPGILIPLVLALLLGACSDPVSPFRPTAEETIPALIPPAPPPVEDPQPEESFTVDIIIGKGSPARSVAGPDSYRIQGDIRNFFQLVVLDENQQVVFYDEKRMVSSSDTELTLKVGDITYGKKYDFLLLMGHWQWEIGKPYQYYDGSDPVERPFRPPTLLAAGLKQDVPIDGDGVLSITVWPIVVDTKFTNGTVTKAPAVRAGVPDVVSLSPSGWEVNWALMRGSSSNGIVDLVAAHNKAHPNQPVTTTLPGPVQGIHRGERVDAKITGNTITMSFETFKWNDIGKTGTVNFNLDYVPFGLDTANYWSKITSSVYAGTVPKWIIRNGVNDAGQDGKTDFVAFGRVRSDGTLIAPGSNGNGAVRYTVSPEPTNDLVVSNGAFKLPSGEKAKIVFTVTVTGEAAEVRYVVEPKNWYTQASPPPYTHYTQFPETSVSGTDTLSKEIDVPLAPKGWDVWVLLYQPGAGKVSVPYRIEGIVTSYGAARYVSPIIGDDDAGTGEPDHPWKTLHRALEVLAAEKAFANNPLYAADPAFAWLRESTAACTINIIEGEVEEAGNRITISDSHPPIVLQGNRSTLQLKVSGDDGSTGSLITVAKGGNLTLGDNLSLRGSVDNNAPLVMVAGKLSLLGPRGGIANNNNNKAANANGGGVYVQGGKFEMTGGTIWFNKSSGKGGGVYVADGAFIMSGGQISSNESSGNGGGVYVESGTFTVSGGIDTGGKILSNTAANGGGVYVKSGTFTMPGGWIDNNTAGNGGGVYVQDGAFTMEGGQIGYLNDKEGNTASGNGGGVYVESGTFTMSRGSTIEYNKAAKGGAVYVQGGTFWMYGGGQISNNKASGNGSDGSGGGVYVGGGTFDMSDGTIQFNTASGGGDYVGSGGGGGVYVESGTFHMSGGTITGNTGPTGSDDWGYPLGGGGVYVGGGEFIMSGGTISENTAWRGGGVYVYAEGDGGKFIKTSGTSVIYGDNDSLRNTASDNMKGPYSHVVYVYVSQYDDKYGNTINTGHCRIRQATVGPNDTLDSGVGNDANGSPWQHDDSMH